MWSWFIRYCFFFFVMKKKLGLIFIKIWGEKQTKTGSLSSCHNKSSKDTVTKKNTKTKILTKIKSYYEIHHIIYMRLWYQWKDLFRPKHNHLIITCLSTQTDISTHTTRHNNIFMTRWTQDFYFFLIPFLIFVINWWVSLIRRLKAESYKIQLIREYKYLLACVCAGQVSCEWISDMDLGRKLKSDIWWKDNIFILSYWSLINCLLMAFLNCFEQDYEREMFFFTKKGNFQETSSFKFFFTNKGKCFS